MLEAAQLIKGGHSWPLLGFGQMDFGDPIQWNRDPLSGRVWPLHFYADIPMWHSDGSDIRVLWELNRLGHFLTLAKAYVVNRRRGTAEEFFVHSKAGVSRIPWAGDRMELCDGGCPAQHKPAGGFCDFPDVK